MIAGELIALFRNAVMDTAVPYLWSQDEAFVYLNDAYTMLVRFMGGVSDSANPITSAITYSAGTTSVGLHPSVLRIVRAFNNAGIEMSVIEDTDIPLVRNTLGKLSLLKVGTESAPDVDYLVMGAEHRRALFHPIPLVGGTVKLHIRRLPINSLLTETDTLPDLQAEHHIHLIDWMKSMAYRKQDAETFNMEKAALAESLFLQYASQATYETSRLNRKSKNSLRSDQDLRNPMVQAAVNRVYRSASAGQQAAPKEDQ